jgi:hypothetical protein
MAPDEDYVWILTPKMRNKTEREELVEEQVLEKADLDRE